MIINKSEQERKVFLLQQTSYLIQPLEGQKGWGHGTMAYSLQLCYFPSRDMHREVET